MIGDKAKILSKYNYQRLHCVEPHQGWQIREDSSKNILVSLVGKTITLGEGESHMFINHELDEHENLNIETSWKAQLYNLKLCQSLGGNWINLRRSLILDKSDAHWPIFLS